MTHRLTPLVYLSALACAVSSANTLARSTLLDTSSKFTTTDTSAVIAAGNISPLKLSSTSVEITEKNGKIVDQKVKIINGKKFTFTKFLQDNGNILASIVDEHGRQLHESEVPTAKFKMIHPEVSSWIAKMTAMGDYHSQLPVDLALDLEPTVALPETIEVGTALVLDGQTVTGTINAEKMDQKTMNAYADQTALREEKQRNQRHEAIVEQLQHWLRQHDLLEAPGVKQALAEGALGASLALTAPQLTRLIEKGDKVLVGIEPTGRHEDDINSAMADTNITNYALPYGITRGNNIGIYMRLCQ